MEVYEQIEAWVQGMMTDAEKIQFERQMQEDVDLAALVRLYRDIHLHLQNESATGKGEVALRSTVREAIDERKAIDTVAAKVIPMRRKWLYGVTAVAAAVVLFISIRFAFFNPAADPGKLYSQYAVFDKLSVTSRGEKEDSILKGAIEKFNSRQYNEAIPYFDRYLSERPDAKYQLARAYALMQENRFAEADSLFKNISSGESLFNEQATWYLALSMLKQGKTESCISLLKTIPAGSDLYTKAQELLDKLD